MIKKLLLICSLCLLSWTSLLAQDSVRADDETSRTGLCERLFPIRHFLGVRGGVASYGMDYSFPGYSQYAHTTNTGLVGGVFYQASFGRHLSLRPEVDFVERGDSLSWLDVGYRMKAHYFDLRLPITYNFRFGNFPLSPYLMAVPSVCVPYAGEISYSADDFPNGVTVPISDADIAKLDYGMMLGGGLEWLGCLAGVPMQISLEMGYNWGLANNFAHKEMTEESVIANWFLGAEMNRGERRFRGPEAAIRVAIPLGDYELPMSKKAKKKVPVVEERVDTVYLKGDTIYMKSDTVYMKADTVKVKEQVVKVVQKNDGVNYIKKDCYSFAEMYSFITLGMDISDKRICMHINFDFDSYQIRESDRHQVDDVVMMMRAYPEMVIQVAGHTDSIGTAEYNQQLSENRAQAVVEYLSRQGIDKSRVEALGYGLREPIDDNGTPEGRFNNRRVEFDIIKIGPRRQDK